MRGGLDNYFTKYNDHFRFTVSGEIIFAKAGKLPQLVERKDLRGDLHAHSKASDGHNTLREMALAGLSNGFEYLAITEHSRRLTLAHGLDTLRLV